MAAPAVALRSASWDLILWEQIDYLMANKDDARFEDFAMLLLIPFLSESVIMPAKEITNG